MRARSYSVPAADENMRLERAGAWYRYAIDGILTCVQCCAHEMADGKPRMRATMRRCPVCGYSGASAHG